MVTSSTATATSTTESLTECRWHKWHKRHMWHTWAKRQGQVMPRDSDTIGTCGASGTKRVGNAA